MHPDLYDEYDNDSWCVRNGDVVISELHALKAMIAKTLRGLPYPRVHFAQEHPDLFALLEQRKGENDQQ